REEKAAAIGAAKLDHLRPVAVGHLSATTESSRQEPLLRWPASSARSPRCCPCSRDRFRNRRCAANRSVRRPGRTERLARLQTGSREESTTGGRAGSNSAGRESPRLVGATKE